MLRLRQLKHPLSSRQKQMRWVNHFFFATAVVFVAHQNIFSQEMSAPQLPQVAQAANMVPRTPPPVYDVDQLSVDEVEVIPYP